MEETVESYNENYEREKNHPNSKCKSGSLNKKHDAHNKVLNIFLYAFTIIHNAFIITAKRKRIKKFIYKNLNNRIKMYFRCLSKWYCLLAFVYAWDFALFVVVNSHFHFDVVYTTWKWHSCVSRHTNNIANHTIVYFSFRWIRFFFSIHLTQIHIHKTKQYRWKLWPFFLVSLLLSSCVHFFLFSPLLFMS